MLKKVFQFILKALSYVLPFVKTEADKFAPIVRAEIERILAEANTKVEDLKAGNSVADIRAQLEADVKVAEDLAKRTVALLREAAEAKIAKVKEVAVAPSVTPTAV